MEKIIHFLCFDSKNNKTLYIDTNAVLFPSGGIITCDEYEACQLMDNGFIIMYTQNVIKELPAHEENLP